MKSEELLELLKQAGIVDYANIFARVQIIYSEAFQMIAAASGRYAQGQDGYIGLCDGNLVLFENTLFGGKPKQEIFRVPLNMVEEKSYKQGLFGLGGILRVKIAGKKYKISAPNKYKQALEVIFSNIK